LAYGVLVVLNMKKIIQKSSKIILSILTLIFCTFLFADLAYAAAVYDQRPILIISDIDDTIKVSEVLTPFVVLRAADTNTPFAGMANLYQLLVNENPDRTKVFYLSNAPKEILGLEPMRISHQALLNNNHFPKGELILRQSIQDEGHKNRTIRELVKKYNPSKVIMFGDNGEKDVFTYSIAASELKTLKIETHTYIHQLYSASNILPFKRGQALLAGQVGFATPIEVGIDLVQKKQMSQDNLNILFKLSASYIMNEDSYKIDAFSAISFPFFKDCSDFQWLASWPLNNQTWDYMQFLEEKCH